MPLPEFLIAGVPKAGTTALHAALVRHPELFLPPVKEPKFFLSVGRPPTGGGPGDVQTYQEHVWRLADYEALFDPAPPGTLRGEATPFYLYDLAAHGRIKSLLPRVKLILLLRDPVDRAHSNWTHLWLPRDLGVVVGDLSGIRLLWGTTTPRSAGWVRGAAGGPGGGAYVHDQNEGRRGKTPAVPMAEPVP